MNEHIITDAGYPVHISKWHDLKCLLHGENSFIVTDSNVFALYAKEFGLGEIENIFVIPAGEKYKTLSTVEQMAAKMLACNSDRSTIVIALGGGVVGDTAGFLASVYMRGVKYIQVPTTLLAQVDSSIGGKTGVNLPDGKNTIGAFHSPESVIINPGFLATLPEREIICGIGEIIKTALLDEEIYSFAVNNIEKLLACDPAALFEAVRLCAGFKAGVVARDFREKGLRKILNAGHTVGHALESAGNYSLSHGEYVLNGILYEMKLFENEIDKKFLKAIENLIKKIITPVIIKDAGRIAALCVNDKKNSGGMISVMVAQAAGSVKENMITEAVLRERIEKCKCLSSL